MALDNQIALVTGASRGIGKAIALRLAHDGAFVIGTATSAKGADDISAYFTESKVKGVGRVLNVADDKSVEELFESVNKEFGAPTILINNAGITRDNLSLRMSTEEWMDVLNTNLTSVFRVSKACLRGMIKARKGRIVNIASVVGSMGNAGQTNYGAAKAGIMGFTKSLAREVASRGVTVNVVAPGYIDTDMTKQLTDAQRESITSAIPLNRLGQPDDIAASVAFLVSDGGGYVTGHTLHVNGGMYMA